jgi:tetratricopeptide (TPR) repeat protein
LIFGSLRLSSVVVILFLAAAPIVAQVSSRAPRPSSISGQITGQVRLADNSGKAAEQILVTLEAYGGGIIDQVRTDSTGKFRFTGVAPELFRVVIRHPGFVEIQREVDLRTVNREYLQLQLAPETPEKRPSGPAAIISVNVPPEAQKELDQGRTILLDEKNVEKAVTHLEKAISLYPNFAEAHLLLGTAFLDNKQWEKAERELKKTLEIDAKAVGAYFALGDAYRQQQKYAEAEKVIHDGLKLEPKSHQGHFTLGQVYFAKGDVAKAGPEVGQALQLKPDYADAYLLAGNLFLKARNAASALQMFEEYLRLEPKGHYATQTREMVEKIRKAMAEKKQ